MRVAITQLVFMLFATANALATSVIEASKVEKAVLTVSAPAKGLCSVKLTIARTAYPDLKRIDLFGVFTIRAGGKDAEKPFGNRFWFERKGNTRDEVTEHALAPVPGCGPVTISINQATCLERDGSRVDCLRNIKVKNKSRMGLTIEAP